MMAQHFGKEINDVLRIESLAAVKYSKNETPVAADGGNRRKRASISGDVTVDFFAFRRPCPTHDWRQGHIRLVLKVKNGAVFADRGLDFADGFVKPLLLLALVRFVVPFLNLLTGIINFLKESPNRHMREFQSQFLAADNANSLCIPQVGLET